jgi:hypothetical protein
MKLAFITVLAIASFTSNSASGWTQPGGSQLVVDQPPAPDTGTPSGQRTPGGTRPELTAACKPTDKPLTALIPENGKGLTTAEYPVFWFYIPYAVGEIESIEFSLHDRNEMTTLYRTSVKLTQTPGVIGISLPQSPEYTLKINESYHWYFTINCQSKETSEEDDIVLDGWVTRVEQDSNEVIWYDELTNIGKRHLSEPENSEVKRAWMELLKSVGLEGLEQEPIVSVITN